MPRALNTLRGGHYATILQGPHNQPLTQQVAGCKVSANVQMVTVETPRGLPEGRVVSLNAQNEWETGVDPADATPLPAILIGTSQYDKDVDVSIQNINPLTQSGELSVYFNGAPTGPVVAVPLSAGYLIATTEYDKTTLANPAPNTALTALRANTNALTGGVVTTGTFKTDHIIGVTIPSQRTHANPELYDAYYPNGMKLLWFASIVAWKH